MLILVRHGESEANARGLLLGRTDRPGVDVLDPDAGVQLGVIGEAGVALLGVDGHLVTLPGELAGEFAQADVVAVRAGAGAGVKGRCVLSY